MKIKKWFSVVLALLFLSGCKTGVLSSSASVLSEQELESGLSSVLPASSTDETVSGSSSSAEAVATELVLGNTVQNILNGSRVVEIDGWVYFSIPKQGLYRFNPQTGESSRVTKTGGYCLQYYQGDLFYIDYDNLSIYRLNLKTGKSIRLNEIRVIKFAIVNRLIYFSDSDETFLYKMNLDGTDPMKLTSRLGGPMNVTKQGIYQGFGSIYRTNYNDENQFICDGLFSQIDQDKLYAYDDFKEDAIQISVMNPDGSDKKS